MITIEIKSELLYTIRINEKVISLTKTQIQDLIHLFKLSENLLNINNYKSSTFPMILNVCDLGHTLSYVVEVKDYKPLYRIVFLHDISIIFSFDSVDYFIRIMEKLQQNDYA